MRLSITLTVFLLFISSVSNSQTLGKETLQSLNVTSYKNGVSIICGTGFIIKPKSKYYLITNWHVVTNQSIYSKKWVVGEKPEFPNEILINHRVMPHIGGWYGIPVRLYDTKGEKTYKQFYYSVEGGQSVLLDVVAIPLELNMLPLDTIQLNPIDYSPVLTDHDLSADATFTVIGFPACYDPIYIEGLKCYPFWKRGGLAFDPYINISSPIYYLDIDGRKGMSGSPVYRTKKGKKKKDNDELLFSGIFCSSKDELGISAFISGKVLKTFFDSLD